ncbi:hypothetical protein EBR03_07230 [bacterium]|nr:hypothetical protein [bacterium]
MVILRTLFLGAVLLGSPSEASTVLLKQLLQENRTEEAVPICRQYEVLPSRDEAVYLACAWVYYRTYRVAAAETLLSKLKNLQTLPEYQLLKIYASVANQLLPPDQLKTLESSAKEQYEEKLKVRLSEAQKQLEAFLIQHKATPMGKLAQELSAEFYELKGQLDPAAFLYRGLIADYPKSGRAHWGLGRYYLARGDIRRAKVSLEKVAEFWPKHVGSRYNLGLIAITEGPEHYREAARWLAEAFKLNSADVGVLEQIGVLLEAHNKIPAAVKYWRRALELNPSAPIALKKVHQHSGAVIEDLIAKKSWKEALEKIETLKEGAASDSEYLLYQGICFRNLGEFEKAKKALSPVVENSPKNALALRELGIAELNLEQTESAVDLFKRAGVLEPKEPLNFAWLGFALEAKKDYGGAISAWNSAATLFTEPEEIKKALKKVVKLEQKFTKRGMASEPKAEED